MLQAQNVTKTYNSGKKVALEDFSIDIPRGSIHGLLGPNGAGKTTFIRMVNQITLPDSGTIYIDGEKLNPEHIKKIGYMPEERGLYKNMTIGSQIVYFGELKGLSKTEALNRARDWFERLEIETWWKKKLSELSKGMAQKIQFVVTVLHQPPLLILDEPFSGFDPVNANLIKDQILGLRDNGTTIILSTHRMESVEEMCDSVTLINQSRKVLDGKIFDIKERFKKNIFHITLEGISQLPNDFVNQHHPENIALRNGLLTFEVKDDQNRNALLNHLMQLGNVRAFDEKIPSMNEVFMSAVQ